jgi:hypothetical protein
MTTEEVQELVQALKLNRHDVVIEAVLAVRVKDMESGHVGISISATDDTDWVTQLGLLRGAEIITTAGIARDHYGGE